MNQRLFTLELLFDAFAESNQLGFRFAERQHAITVPGDFQPVKPHGNRIFLGHADDEIFVRIGVWGRNFQPVRATLNLVVEFEAAIDAGPNQVASPFDPNHSEITERLAAGITLSDDNLFVRHETVSYWVLDPRRFGLPVAGLRDAPDSVLFFSYFPALTHGRYEVKSKLHVETPPLRFYFDPEMEVGELDDPSGSDTNSPVVVGGDD